MASPEAPIATDKSAPKAKGALLRRVSGSVRPRGELLEEVETYAADLRSRLPAVLHPFLIPNPHKVYRWKVELACGNITELLTQGIDDYPDGCQHRDPVHRILLKPGEMWCHDEAHWDAPRPFADITVWVSSDVKEFPPDPVEPPDDWEPDLWALIRHDERHSSRFWRVRLACGHEQEHVVTSVDWHPDDGPKLVTVERAEAMRVETEECWASELATTAQEELMRNHWRKMLALCFPRPEPEQECWTCPHAVPIVVYQRIGWLIAPPRPQKPTKPRREQIEERIARADAEAARLRRQLDQLD